MRRLPRGLLVATVAAGVATLAAAVEYGGHAAGLTAMILLPLGWLTVLATSAAVGRRRRLGGLGRQFGVVAMIAAGQLVVGVALFVSLMFVSAHDALMAVLLAADCGVLALWAALQIGREAAAEADVMVARLHEEEEARGRLIAAVSHDLRTPLTALRLLADVIGDDLADPDERREYARRMSTHLTALGALVDDLFELTRLQSGDLGWTTEPLRVELLVAEAVDAMRPAAAAEAVVVQAEPSAPLPPVEANADKVQRVLFNLIQNAIRHTPPDGSVTVRAVDAQGAVEVEVADTGAGIPAEIGDRVFEPFFRADAARSDGGAGLGLAIARAIVEAHGGRMWLEHPPVGAAVRFRLPGVAVLERA